MTSYKSIYLVPKLLWNGITMYWWSTHIDGYRIGEKGRDWGGPFPDENSAFNHAEAQHKGKDITLQAFRLALNTDSWPDRPIRLGLHFGIPLDEYIEHVFLSDASSAERKVFLHALSADVDLAPTKEEPDFLITGTSLAKSHLVTEKLLAGKAYFHLPAYVTLCTAAPATPLDSLLKSLRGKVTLQGLYDEEFIGRVTPLF